MDIKIARCLYQEGKLLPTREQSFDAAIGRVTKPWIYTLSNEPSQDRKLDLDGDTTGLLKRYITRTTQEGLDIPKALYNFEESLSPLFERPPVDVLPQFAKDVQSRSVEKINNAKAFMSKYGIDDRQLQSFVQQGEQWASPSTLSRMRHDMKGELTICKNGEQRCDVRSEIWQPSNAFARNVINAVQSLHAEGAFSDSQEQKAFAENVLAGAKFYHIPLASPPAATFNKAAHTPAVWSRPSFVTP